MVCLLNMESNEQETDLSRFRSLYTYWRMKARGLTERPINLMHYDPVAEKERTEIDGKCVKEAGGGRDTNLSAMFMGMSDTLHQLLNKRRL